MKKTIELTLCNHCEKEIKNDNYINLPKGDLDAHGIWFGNLRSWLWFDDEHFCSINCFMRFITAWTNHKWDVMNNDE